MGDNKTYFNGAGGLVVPRLAADPGTTVNGEIYYNTALNKFRSYQNGSWSDTTPTSAGDVVGPASSTNNGFAKFDGTTGKLLKNSAATISNADVDAAAAIALTKLAAQTVSRAAAFDASGFLVPATTTAAELDFVNLTRSNIQAQIDGQAANNARNLNWISNYGAEVNATGYNAYADAAQSTPENGTGGSPNVTVARNTSSPLNGIADLLFTKDAANRQGQGFSYDFTIDSAYQATVQQIAFNYKIASGTYASGDLTVWVYDVTNSVLLSQPSGNSIINTSVASQQGQCTFQTAINSTSYRLIFHVASTSASAYTVQIDNISVGPQVAASGSVDTDWVAFTPTGSWSTNTTYTGFYKRDGADALIKMHVATAGAPTSASLTINLPSGITIDTARMPTVNQDMLLGMGLARDNATASFQVYAGYNNTTSVALQVNGVPSAPASIKATSPVNASNPMTWASGDSLDVEFRIPVVGWGSNNVMSTSGNTRVVAASAHIGSAASTTAGNPFNFDTVDFDTHAAITTGTTTWKYTCPVPGIYDVSSSVYLGGAAGFHVYKNGTLYRWQSLSINASAPTTGSTLVQCATGDTLSIVGTATGTPSATGSTTVAQTNYINIKLIQGPQQIAASETIAASYYVSANFAATSSVPINFDTKIYDTHNAVTPSATVWKFTAPAPGFYSVGGFWNVTAGITGAWMLYKNGSALQTISHANTTVSWMNSSVDVLLAAGDTIAVRPTVNATIIGNTLATAETGYITIRRLGGG